VLITVVEIVTVEFEYCGVVTVEGVELAGIPGAVEIPSEGLPNPPLALAASTMAVMRPARASSPNNPSNHGLQQVLLGASVAVGGGGTDFVA
jgi:hypothetical protein